MSSLTDFLAAQQQLVDQALDRLTPPESALPQTIHRAMRYSLFAGGKRIRPILCLQAAAAVSDQTAGTIEAACALEMIHTYSLIHDDLPALDNDDFRRGKPTNHKVFGDAMAILAGDALFTLAIQTLTKIEGLDAVRKLALVEELSFASGTVDGMIGGQVTDIEGERQPPTAELLDRIHRAKTGALLRASVRMGAIAAGGRRTIRMPFPVTVNTWGSLFRSWTTFSTWKNLPPPWARRREKTPLRARLPSRRCMGSTLRAAWRRSSAAWLTKHWNLRRPGRAPSRDSRSDRAPEVLTTMPKLRLDLWMVGHGLTHTRERAQALIMAGEVMLNGQKALKSSQMAGDDARVEVLSKLRYASRGGLKLEAALAHFGIDVTGLVCADFGSSTGGFTDCLLQAGAARVHAIDVGTGQLDWKLRNDPRVIVREGINARYLDLADLGRSGGSRGLRRQFHLGHADFARPWCACSSPRPAAWSCW